MTKDNFYKYDFYNLEQKYSEDEFIKILDDKPLLNNAIVSFMQNLVDLLFKSNRNIQISKIALPQIEDDLENILKGIHLYDIYFESNPKNKLSDVVFNKFLSRIFSKDGFNNEQYFIQKYIHTWLEKRLAIEIVKDSRFNSVSILTSLIEKTEMLHSFYIYLIKNIPQDWVTNNNDWSKISSTSENIIDNIRPFDKGYFNNYIRLLDSADKTSLWNYAQKATHESDYAMLNKEYSFRSSVLIKNDISLWIEFWDNLKFPIIQDCVFHSFFDFKPQQYIELVSILVSKKTKSDINVLLLIIAKNYFQASYKLTERLSFYEEEDRIKVDNKHFFEEGQKFHKEWLNEKPKYYKALIENLQTKLNNTDIESWIFSYKPRINNHQKHNEIYNSEINLLTSIYKSYCNQSISFDLKSFNLQKFNFYVDIVRDSKNKIQAENLLEIIINFILSDKFFWDKSYSEPYLSSMRGIGYLISLHSNPTQKSNELIEEFKVNHQGWKPFKFDFQPLMKESFVYSTIALIFEHDSSFKNITDKDFFFKEFLNTILVQNRYSQIDNSDYYQHPLHLLFLVGNQLSSEIQEYFESELIENYDDLYSLLSILSNDKKTISNQSKILLEERLKKEFLIEKRQFKNRGQEDKVQELEKMIEKLKLSL